MNSDLQSFGVIPYRVKDGVREYLLLQSVNGHWCFPKGGAGAGESVEETALREFKEETGIQQVVLKTEQTFEENYTLPRGKEVVHKKVTYFLGEVSGQETVNFDTVEIQDFVWLPFAEAEQKATYQETKNILIDAEKVLSK